MTFFWGDYQSLGDGDFTSWRFGFITLTLPSPMLERGVVLRAEWFSFDLMRINKGVRVY
jgi:hypothetical protein